MTIILNGMRENIKIMEELELIIEDIRCATFHMSNEEAVPIIDMFLERNPKLLEYHDKNWYYKNC